jgi:hypothetical protein
VLKISELLYCKQNKHPISSFQVNLADPFDDSAAHVVTAKGRHISGALSVVTQYYLIGLQVWNVECNLV